MPFVLGTLDTILTDFNMPISPSKGGELEAFLRSTPLKLDGKQYVDRRAFDDLYGQLFVEEKSDGASSGIKIRASEKLLALTDGQKPVIATGGSMPNLARTFVKLLDEEKAAVNFVAILANDRLGRANRAYLEDAGVRILPQSPEAVPLETSMSLAFMRKLSTTYGVFDGGAKAFMKPSYITRDFIESSTMILLPGSAKRKFDPEISDRVFDMTRESRRLLGYILPSGEDAARKYSEHSRTVIPYADFVGGNVVELSATLFPERDAKKVHPDEAVIALQKMFATPLIAEGKFGRDIWKGYQIGLISKGKHGAYIVTPHEIIERPAAVLKLEKSTGGAGDSLAGTGLACLVMGGTLVETLETSLHGAAAKIETSLAAGMAHPREEVCKRTDCLDKLRVAFIAPTSQPATVHL